MGESVKIIFIGMLCGVLVVGGIVKYNLADNQSSMQYGDFSAVVKLYDEKLVLFTNSTCEFCLKEKIFLDANGIKYREVVIDKDKAGYLLLEQLGEESVPILYSFDKKMVGFNRNSLSEFIGPFQN